ncbi:MAG TPA: hypothetical protein DD670_14710 [Planctomycetaceae bacterium]|nr:hypothetical protein [Planctomycetaceae bacterium]
MSSAGNSPRNLNFGSSEGPVSKEQLRKDRINLALVLVVFGGLIGLMIWLASMSPAPVEYDFSYPLIP